MKPMLLFLLTAGACSSFSPDLGEAPYLCGDIEPRCPEGYTCDTSDPDPARHTCVAPGGIAPDAPPTGFQCLDDSSFGSNDTKDGAFPTPVAASSQSFSALAAICPELDKDHYAFDIVTQNSNVEAITSWETGMPVNVQILNTGGTSIGNGSPMGDKAFRVCVANLPVGTYYVSAFAASSIKNNYRVELKIVPNC